MDLGGLYVNDFNQFGRTWQVNLQADTPFRMHPEDFRRLYVRNTQGGMVPLSTVAKLEDRGGPFVVNRYNLWPAAANQRLGPAGHELRTKSSLPWKNWPTRISRPRWATNGPT